MQRPHEPTLHEFGIDLQRIGDIKLPPDGEDLIYSYPWLLPVAGIIPVGLYFNEFVENIIDKGLFFGLLIAIVMIIVTSPAWFIIGFLLIHSTTSIIKKIYFSRNETARKLRDYQNARAQYQAQLAIYNSERRKQFGSYWEGLRGSALEREVGRLLQANGYEVQFTPKTGDGGADLIVEGEEKKAVVQCKGHAKPVGISTLRQLYATKDDFDADLGILVAPNGVTKPSRDYLHGRDLHVWTSQELTKIQMDLMGEL